MLLHDVRNDTRWNRTLIRTEDLVVSISVYELCVQELNVASFTAIVQMTMGYRGT